MPPPQRQNRCRGRPSAGGVRIMEHAGRGLGEADTEGTNAEQNVLGHVHALFPKPVDGDDALLTSAGLLSPKWGTGAEVYAHTPDQLDYVLQFVPSHARLPVVHLSRGINVLNWQDPAGGREFADRLAGR